MLKPEYKQLWIKALRSKSRYRQGIGCLRTRTNSYCCLGVLCDLVNGEGWEIHRDGKLDSKYHYRFRYGDQADGSVAPTGLRELVGLEKKMMIKLSNMNDGGKYTFKDIADYIEKKL